MKSIDVRRSQSILVADGKCFSGSSSSSRRIRHQCCIVHISLGTRRELSQVALLCRRAHSNGMTSVTVHGDAAAASPNNDEFYLMPVLLAHIDAHATELFSRLRKRENRDFTIFCIGVSLPQRYKL